MSTLLCRTKMKKSRILCAICNKNTRMESGVEVAHIFLLGTKYTSVFGFNTKYLNDVDKNVEMSCYGIGVSRILSLVVENNHDFRGILWPIKIAPFTLSIIVVQHQITICISRYIYNKLCGRGIHALYDSRN